MGRKVKRKKGTLKSRQRKMYLLNGGLLGSRANKEIAFGSSRFFLRSSFSYQPKTNQNLPLEADDNQYALAGSCGQRVAATEIERVWF